MATAAEALVQLNRDLGDHFASTTTSAGTSTTLTDTELANYDDDEFINKFDTWLKVISGTDVNLIRRITSKSGAVATHVALPTGTDSGASYQIHRVARPDDKDDAITRALNILNGVVLFKKAHSDVTIVADQFDYDVPSGFYQDQVRQIHLVSSGDTEITRQIFDWEPRVDSGGGNDIHFFSRYQAGEKVRVFGHQTVALSDFTDGDGSMLILSARAAMLIYNDIIATVPTDEVARYQTLLTNITNAYNERVVRFKQTGIPLTLRSQAYRGATTDRDFSTVT